MKSFSLWTKTYLIATWLAGLALFIWNAPFFKIDVSRLTLLAVLMLAASLAQIFKVEGATHRSHYATSFVVYSFSLLRMGVPETILVIIVSNLAEWLWHRSPWFIALFNTACYIIVIQIAELVYALFDPTGSLQGLNSVIGILLAMITFTMLNHLMVGAIIWLARGENFAQSGIFRFMPLIIDLTMLVMGASLNVVWNFNPYAVLLFIIPVYLIYSTLRVPALERKTELDQKTGVYNHAYFMQQLANELARANRYDRPLTVIMSDLDLLRNINNTYGHLAGDEVLKGVAKIIQSTVREYDVVARFGGEEFVILMPETTVQTGYERAEEIRKAIEQAEFPIPTSVTPIQVTISLGVAGREKGSRDCEEIIHNADMALYHSKLKGRNRTYVYESGMFEELFAKTEEAQEWGEFPAGMEPGGQQADQTFSGDEPAGMIPPRLAYSGHSEQVELRAAGGSSNTPALTFELSARQSEQRTNTFIGLVAAAALALFLLFFHELPGADVFGLGLFVSVVVVTELLSIEIYVRDTAVSTSAAPILAGILLFGPVGALVLSLAFALTAFIRSRGPVNRLVFNCANQLIAGTLCLTVLRLTPPLLAMPYLVQLLVCVSAVMVTYVLTTGLIALGIGISKRQNVRTAWRERFRWLAPYYVVMGLVAYALVFGYTFASAPGVLAILAPLFMLRLAQKQYLDHTRAMVLELREKNQVLEKSAREITKLNDGLLDVLAEIVDLHDCYVLGHSRQVTIYAVQIAHSMGLHERQIELIRKASLLHDLGKLGVPEYILRKPTRLSEEEYKVMKMHPIYGARLLEKSGALTNLIPVIKQHHEHYDGSGYPEGIHGSEISIEARIVAVADAIEAMASNRSYRKAISREDIIDELARNSGTQFDPHVIAAAIRLLESGEIVLNRLEAEPKKAGRYTFAG